jgi:hypothetical protein
MRPDSITLAIFEKYTAEELATTAQHMAQAQSDLEGVEAEKKTSDAAFKERINQHSAQVSELAKRFLKGGETAQIGCHIRYDIPTVGKKSYIRMDTEETVEVHDMSFEEKQETLQFPLTKAADEPAQSKPAKTVIVITKTEEPPAPKEISFKDVQGIAAYIATLPEDQRPMAMLEMQKNISAALLTQKKVIGPDGQVETVETSDVAEQLAQAWLELAAKQQTEPPAEEEVTRLCPFPGCILFAWHEGLHEFPKGEAPADAATNEPTPQLQPEKEGKKKKKRPFSPPPDPPSDQPPTAGAD